MSNRVESWAPRGFVPWVCLAWVPWMLPTAVAQGGGSTPEEGASAGVWSFEELEPLPDPIGFAGPYVGRVGDSLLVAGGANFPGGRPWDGHSKIWHDRMFLLDEPDGRWRELEVRLPRASAYGLAVEWGDALLCVGGGNADEHHGLLWKIEPAGEGVEISSLPSLPLPLAFHAGALVGDRLLVAGGLTEPGGTSTSDQCWSLDLGALDGSPAWQRHPSWPGRPRMLATGGADAEAFYLFGGTDLAGNGLGGADRVPLQDAYRFGFEQGWTRLADLPHPVIASPGPAALLSGTHFAIFGGDDGSLLGQDLRDAHPGFPPEVLAYHRGTDAWRSLGRLPKDVGPQPGARPEDGVWPPVTTGLTRWRGRWILASGEVRPGVRTNRVLAGTFEPGHGALSAVDWGVLVAYLVILVVLGVRSTKGSGTSDEFFRAGKRLGPLVVGLSIFGTQLSAITYLAVPATSFGGDWTRWGLALGILVIAPVVATYYLPALRRLDVTSAYEFLEHRFSLGIRWFGSLSFIAFQLGRMGIVVLLPSLALAAATGMSVTLCIFLMGVLSTGYTVVGGIAAVILTDAVQVVVLIGGALAALVVIHGALPGGLGEVIQVGGEFGKTAVVQLEGGLVAESIFVIVLAGIFGNLVQYTTDQAVIQRYLTTPTEREAKKAIWLNGILSVPASLLFFFLGTALFAFYRARPEGLAPLEKADQILPWFLAHEMGAGMAGLVIAGVFAAAMSSLDSSMHAIATAVSTDFVKRLRPATTGAGLLRVARALTLLLGVLGTGAAWLLSQRDIQSLWDAFLVIVGLALGPVGGLFALGVFVPRVGVLHAWVGVFVGIGSLLLVRTQTPWSGLLYSSVGLLGCFVAAVLVSFIVPRGEATESKLPAC